MGIVAGWFSMKLVLPITDEDFTYGARFFWRPFDASYSVIKAFFFAASITIISCYMGFNTQQGAEGVGRSTTGAVVASSVLILLLDVLLAKLLLSHMIELRDVQKRFGKQVVLDGVDFTVQEGETVALLGPSGHRQERAAQAHHRTDPARRRASSSWTTRRSPGSSGRSWRQLRSQIGYVFQNGALFDSMNVFENVRLGHHRRGKVPRPRVRPGAGAGDASGW